MHELPDSIPPNIDAWHFALAQQKAYYTCCLKLLLSVKEAIFYQNASEEMQYMITNKAISLAGLTVVRKAKPSLDPIHTHSLCEEIVAPMSDDAKASLLRYEVRQNALFIGHTVDVLQALKRAAIIPAEDVWHQHALARLIEAGSACSGYSEPEHYRQLAELLPSDIEGGQASAMIGQHQ